MMTRPENGKYLSYLLAAVVGLSPLLGHSHFLDLFDKDDPSARITMTTEGDLAKKSGEKTRFTGSVELVDSKGRGESCSSFLKRKGLKIRAFFPDATTEVTSKLVLNSSGQKVSFRYDTPALSTEDSNALTVVVSKEGGFVLQVILAKLQWTIRTLDRKIADLIRHKAPARVVAEAKALRNSLQASADEITKKIEQDTEGLAERTYALQVGNEPPASSVYRVVDDGLQYLISMTPGVTQEGNDIRVNGSVLQVGRPDSKELQARFFWNGSLVNETASQKLPNGAGFSFSYDAKNLRSTASNQFKIDLLTVERSKKKVETKLLNSHSLSEPLIVDRVAPVWGQWVSPQQNSYLSQAVHVSTSASDPFGALDRSSLSARIIGTAVDQSAIDIDVTSNLNLNWSDSDQSVEASGTLPALDEGNYSLRLIIKDKAGNLASPSPNLVSFYLDRTVPTLSGLSNENYYTRSSSYEATIQASDRSPLSSDIFHNGEKILTSTQNSFIFQRTLAEGINTFEVISRDAAGNVSIPLKSGQIILDTIKPVIQILTQNHQQVTNPSFQVNYTIMDQSSIVTHLYLNGERVHSSSTNENRVTVTLKQGVNQIEVRASDLAGNIADIKTLDDIRLDTPPLILSNLIPAAGTTISTPTFPVSGRASNELASVTLNGQPIAIGSDKKSFSGQGNASVNGPLNLIWQATDIHGKSVTQTVALTVEFPPEPGEDGDSEELPSLGSIQLEGVDPATFNPTSSTLEFIVSDAQISSTVSDLIISINDVTIPRNQITLAGNRIRVSNVLQDGLNRISFRVLDTVGRVLTYGSSIWAGSQSVQVRVVNSNQSPVTQAEVVLTLPGRIQFLEKEEVATRLQTSSLGYATFSSVPRDAQLVIIARDSQQRMGLAHFNGASGSIQIQVLDNSVPSPIANNDFSLGTQGWNIAQARTQFISHEEDGSNNPSKQDLILTTPVGQNQATVTRTIQSPANARFVSTRFSFIINDETATMSVMIRSLATGKFSLKTITAKEYLFSSSQATLVLPWEELSISVEQQGETFEVVYRMSRSSELQSSTWKNGFEKVVQWIQPSDAYALTLPWENSSIRIEKISYPERQILGSKFFDFNLAPGASRRCENELSYFSIGPIPHLGSPWNSASNRICGSVLISALPQDSIQFVWLEISQLNNPQKALGSIIIPTNLSRSPSASGIWELPLTDQVWVPSQLGVLRFRPDPTLASNLINPDLFPALNLDPAFVDDRARIKVKVRFTSGQEIELPSKDPLPVLINFRPVGTRYETNRDLEQGGDDWGRPFLLQFLTALDLEKKDLKLAYNDLSNMNGGRFYPRKLSHQNGLNADLHTINFNETNSGTGLTQNAAKDALEILKSQNAKYIDKLIATIDTNTVEGKKASDRLSAECLPDGRTASAVVEHLADHDTHFHLQFGGTVKDHSIPESKRPNEADFFYRFRPNGSLIVDFVEDKNAPERAVAWAIYNHEDVFLGAFDSNTDFQQVFGCTPQGLTEGENGGCFNFPYAWRFKIKVLSKSGNACRVKTRILEFPGEGQPTCESENPQERFGRRLEAIDGTLGGFVGRNAKVDDTSWVDAQSAVCGNSQVRERSTLSSSLLENRARVLKNSTVRSSKLKDRSAVYDNATVEFAELSGDSVVQGAVFNPTNWQSFVGGYPKATISGLVRIYLSFIGGPVTITGGSGAGVKIIESQILAAPDAVSIRDQAQLLRSFTGKNLDLSGSARVEHCHFSGSLSASGNANVSNSEIFSGSVSVSGNIDWVYFRDGDWNISASEGPGRMCGLNIGSGGGRGCINNSYIYGTPSFLYLPSAPTLTPTDLPPEEEDENLIP